MRSMDDAPDEEVHAMDDAPHEPHAAPHEPSACNPRAEAYPPGLVRAHDTSCTSCTSCARGVERWGGSRTIAVAQVDCAKADEAAPHRSRPRWRVP